jgi:quercetin dioxygenase-like cupin family protein
MTLEVATIPRPGWDPLPDSTGIVGRVLVREWGFFIAELRFSEHASITEHADDNDAIVTCIQGEGFTSVAGETMPIQEEQQVRWPMGVPHALWTEGSTMTTLMFGRIS